MACGVYNLEVLRFGKRVLGFEVCGLGAYWVWRLGFWEGVGVYGNFRSYGTVI